MTASADHDAIIRLEGDVRVEEARREDLDRLVHIELMHTEQIALERFAARDKAVIEAKDLALRVQLQQNEWRTTVETLAANKADERELDLLREEMKQVREEVAQSRGKGLGAIDVRAWAVAIAAVVAAVIGFTR